MGSVSTLNRDFPLIDQSFLERQGMVIPEIRFRNQVEKLAALHSAAAPGPVLFVGDSDMRLWSDANGFAEFFADLPALNLGFGGARTWEVLVSFQALILPRQPRVIVYCAGDNDISCQGETGARNAEIGFRLFAELVAAHVPSVTAILYLAIHPSPCDEPLWSYIRQANARIQPFCARSATRLEFVDYLHLLLDSNGRPKPEMFAADDLHFSKQMYRHLGAFLRPKILAL